MNELRITRPDDWHLHLRDGAALAHTVPAVARYFGRAVVMPNLTPPITSAAQAAAYRARIEAAQADLPRRVTPLMTLYLTDTLDAAEIGHAHAAGAIQAAKLYPAGATTNSAAGVTDLSRIYPLLEALQAHDLPLLIHGEVTDPAADIFDRERAFIDHHLRALVADFPRLRIVLEHITTADAVTFVSEAPAHVAATITAHHLLFNRNHMLVGGIRPHFYCLPILKRSTHQHALLQAATSGNPKFFLGTDSAPHDRDRKETSCGCAGSYTAHAALELYAAAFEAAQALDKLEGFASHFGADFYGLARNTDEVVLRREPWLVPPTLPLGEGQMVPIAAGETLQWRVVEDGSGRAPHG